MVAGVSMALTGPVPRCQSAACTTNFHASTRSSRRLPAPREGMPRTGGDRATSPAALSPGSSTYSKPAMYPEGLALYNVAARLAGSWDLASYAPLRPHERFTHTSHRGRLNP